MRAVCLFIMSASVTAGDACCVLLPQARTDAATKATRSSSGQGNTSKRNTFGGAFSLLGVFKPRGF